MTLIIRYSGILGLLLLAVVGRVNGQDLEPRSYVNLPIGQTFLALGYLTLKATCPQRFPPHCRMRS